MYVCIHSAYRDQSDMKTLISTRFNHKGQINFYDPRNIFVLKSLSCPVQPLYGECFNLYEYYTCSVCLNHLYYAYFSWNILHKVLIIDLILIYNIKMKHIKTMAFCCNITDFGVNYVKIPQFYNTWCHDFIRVVQ